MRHLILVFISICSLSTWPVLGLAQINLSGTFMAEKSCPATVKLRENNPGNIKLGVGQSYKLLAKNRADATHYRIEIPNAPSMNKRWVAAQCGSVKLTDLQIGDGAGDEPTASIVPGSIENILAVSWMPAFCVSKDAYNRDGSLKTECKNMRPDSAYASQFSIHGLWPNDLDDKAIYPCYCQLDKPISCREFRQPFDQINISEDIKQELQSKMPGIQSGFLHRHEWTKHGTCYEKYDVSQAGHLDQPGSDAEEYYRDTIHLLDQLNGSQLAKLFKDNLGKNLSIETINRSIRQSFGEGAGKHIFVECEKYEGGWIFSELYIGLKGPINPQSNLADLINNSPETSKYSDKQECQMGRVLAAQ